MVPALEKLRQGKEAAGVGGSEQRWLPGEPRASAPPLPTRGPGSYSSPSRHSQAGKLSAASTARGPGCLRAGRAQRCGLGGWAGWPAAPGLLSPATGGVLRVSLSSPHPLAPALNAVCALPSSAAGGPGHVPSRAAVLCQGTGLGQSPGCLWCWSPPSSDAWPLSRSLNASTPGLTLLLSRMALLPPSL